MKAPLLLSLSAASLLFSACETTVVDRRPVSHRRTVYVASAPRDHVIYRDSRSYDGRGYHDSGYRRTYSGDRTIYVAPGTSRDYARRPVDRSYGF